MATDPQNPYRSPVATPLEFHYADDSPAYSAPSRRLRAGQGAAWIGSAWRLLMNAPLMWLAAMLLMLAMSTVLNMIPVLGSLLGLLLAPSFSVGVLAFGQSHARRGSADIGQLFAGFQGDRVGALMIMSLLFMALMMLAAIALMGFLALALGGAGLMGSLSSEESLRAAVLGGGGLILMLGLLIFLLGMMVATAAYWFAPGLIYFAGLNPVDAMKESLLACLHNWAAFLVYSLAAAGLLLLGSIPFGLGLLVVGPLLMASVYTSFEDLFGKE